MRFLVFNALVLSGLLALAGCTSVGEVLGTSKPKPPVTDASQPEIVNPVKVGKINKGGGTRIVALVNDTPITSSAVRRRAAFLKLRRVGGNRNKKALDELVDEALQMKEARRLGAVPPDAQVDEAYRNFAKRNRMPLSALNTVLNRSGVTSRGFKDYIRHQIAWQNVVGLRYQAGATASSRPAGPLDHLHGGNKNRGTATEYTIKQVVFVVPQNRRDALLNRRVSEANNLRTRWPGCENIKATAATLKDVTVLDRGRVQAHELPPRWRTEIEKTPAGKTTRPLKTEKGVEMIAVCNTRETLSTKAVAADGEGAFTQSSEPNKAVAELSKKYMEELKKVGTIVYR